MDEILAPPIPYIKTFNPASLPKEKLEYVDNDNNKNTYKFPTFSGCLECNAEAFLHVLSYFNRHAIDRLHLPETMLFNRIEDVLTEVAQAFFVTTVLPKCTNDFTERNWRNRYAYAIDMMKKRFCGGERARDHQIAYLRSDSCKKKASCSVESHVGRLMMMFEYTNQLPQRIQPGFD